MNEHDPITAGVYKARGSGCTQIDPGIAGVVRAVLDPERRLLDQFRQRRRLAMIGDGLVTLEKAEVLLYRAQAAKGS